MVKFYLFALNTQEIKIGVILVLRHTEYLPLLKVQHKFSVALILLKRGTQLGLWITALRSQPNLLSHTFHLPSYQSWLGFGLY